MAKFASNKSIVPYPGIRFCRVESVITKEFGDIPFPLLTWEDGSVCPSANAYLMYQMQMHGSPSENSSINHCIAILCHMMDYLVATRKNSPFNSLNELHSFLKEFGAALSSGTIRTDGTDPTGLFWTGIKNETISIYARWLNEYFDYLAQYHNVQHFNPIETRLIKIGKDFLQNNPDSHQRKSMFYHLFARAAQSTGVEKKDRAVVLQQSTPRQHGINSMKIFPMSLAVHLIDYGASSIRDKMILLLLLFGGAPRGSEIGHIFRSDVYWNKDFHCIVTFDQPSEGQVYGEPGITREDFLRKSFANHSLEDGHLLRDLKPRHQYSNITGNKDKLYCGWKSMRFTNSNNGYLIDHMVHWIEPAAGVYFYKLYQQYMKDYLEPGGEHFNPNSALHPFLFVSADNKGKKSTLPPGYPLSMSALHGVFKRACNNIGLPSPGMHSARHGYGYYAVNVLKVEKTMLSTMLRHCSPSAVDAYYHLDNLTIHNFLGGSAEVEDTFQRLSFPAHWTNLS